LIHGEEEELYGDRAYWSEDDRASFESAEVRYKVNRRGTAKNPVTEEWKETTGSVHGSVPCASIPFSW
jgi:hypothetical protein